jgi:hypothetical protein
VAIGHLTNAQVPSPTKSNVDVTDFDSTAREKLPTLPDNGELPIGGFYTADDVGQAYALADANDPTSPIRNFRIQLVQQGVEFGVQGYLTSFVINASGPDDAVTFDGTILTSGPTVEADLSS